MRRRTREAESPDITPLIDVVFLLLIFFMTSTVFKKDELALLLNLPKTTKGESQEAQKENVYIELSENEVAYNGAKMSLEDVEAKLSAIEKKDTPIELRVDKDVRYERVVKLLDKLKVNNLANISLITEN
ncbi:transport energizing protein, ExbD/TolR family [Bacteriovorax sp. BSW11_IV]|uniref:ExbD/TolR family protein n=1 Tax=Bacteriovorax sp. BSW11_IV TaxID=1353529 RepID=UPI000389EBF7|nr:biopolymer transporter ExbD [Bacteriovorax sp. BSW11_IV]EQC49167.1 transport energizing protein, ExbD/TolR family [Bacteriovorax sp. BSW11_IV]